MDRIPRSLEMLRASLAQLIRPRRKQLLDLVANAKVKPEDLEPWADYDHPSTDSYGRRLVCHGGHFELMVMTWLPADVSAIHDHGGAEWGAVQCFGEALHDTFRLEGMRLIATGSRPYRPGDIQWVDPPLIHQMGNLDRPPFLSLHVYGCGEARELITGQARLFDLDEGEIQYTNGGVFHALPEACILQRKLGLLAANDLVARQRRFKADRLARMGYAAS
jgi:predicted metal-dependent enzyme (double-stranded beta helix superfamily)